ncbi:MAG: hypothetical protein H7039_17505, partial [Bryobacteraceae bacterium]|nr:hypothetical protein [Bryobacteraceae bacterium]
MRVLLSVILAGAICAPLTQASETDIAKARLFEREGDSLGARQVLQRSADDDLPSLIAYAEFLDRHRETEARQTYEKVLPKVAGQQANGVARRLIELDLIAGDRDAAIRHYKTFQSTGGGDITPSMLQALNPDAKAAAVTAPIPGPLRSFARMAALSPDLNASELLPALARNIVTNGYQASASAESLEQTEFLKLVVRYLSQARELEKLAVSTNNTLKIETCESTQTADLLRVLGYRMRGGCGSDVVLETVNATRAFLTIDSGFPLAELEQSLRTNRPFVYDYRPTQVPVLYGTEYWISALDKQSGEFIDAFLSDPQICRLYLGLSKVDPETADSLKKIMPAAKLKAFAHVLDFYGGMFEIRNGVAQTPGGEKAWGAWQDLVGKSPKDGSAFYE